MSTETAFQIFIAATGLLTVSLWLQSEEKFVREMMRMRKEADRKRFLVLRLKNSPADDREESPPGGVKGS
jgi:hypothetical protein